MFKSCLQRHWVLPLLSLHVILNLFATLPVAARAQYNENENHTDTAVTAHSYFGGVDHGAYISWYESIQSKYTGKAFISRASTTLTSSNNATSSSLSTLNSLSGNSSVTASNMDGVAVHWYLDESYVYVGVATRAQNGWVALGLAEAGGMKGSDIVIYETSRPTVLTDAHVLDQKVAPLTDVCQDWTYINSVNDDGFLIFEGKRLLDTMDGQDHSIINDTESYIPAQRIIAAWGNESDTIAYHGTNRVRGAIRFYGSTDEATKFKSLTDEADGSFVLFASNHTIENITAAYIDFCFNWDTDIVPQGVLPNTNIYAIAVEAILDDEGGTFVHHAAVTASTESNLNASRTCIESGIYGVFLYSWTPGTYPLVLPSGVGIAMGPNDGAIRSFKIQIHYDNPTLISGVRDSSGLRIYYKYVSPKNLAGLLPLGDILTSLKGTTIESGTARYDFACSEQCSILALSGEPVTVIGEFFHMHNRGASAIQYQIRNGEVIRQANVNFFDFNQAGVHAVRQQPYQIYPGDAFRTSCFYQTEGDTMFGDDSVDEMCNAVILYYPAKTLLGQAGWSCCYNLFLPACNATLTSSVINSDGTSSPLADDSIRFSTGNAPLERTFGYNDGNQCINKNDTLQSSSSSLSKLNVQLFLASLIFINV